MTEIDLVDWTIQEVQHLKTERREPGDVKDNLAVDNLLAVLEPEPMGRTAPEGPVAPIAGISPTVEEPVARPSSAIVADTKPVTGSDLPALDKLLAVLEPELMGRTVPKGPVALIAGISPTVEEPVARPSSAIVADTKPVTGSDLPALDKLLAVLEPELMGRTVPKGPVARIAGISPTVEEPVARPSSAIVADTKPVTGSDLPALDKLLAVLEPELMGRTVPKGPVARIAGISPTVEEPVARPSSAILADTKPVTGSDLLAVLEPEPMGRTVPKGPVARIAGISPTVEEPVARPSSSISAETLTAEPKSALLMAIVEPDIYTARADRDRAVALRWVLRDIKSNRLKWSPVDQDDLRILIEMGLVEMRNDATVLTDAGIRAIS
jgi:hypothetical protein